MCLFITPIGKFYEIVAQTGFSETGGEKNRTLGVLFRCSLFEESGPSSVFICFCLIFHRSGTETTTLPQRPSEPPRDPVQSHMPSHRPPPPSEAPR